jgi:hypothetical protein
VTDKEQEEAFLSILDGIIESSAEFVADDGIYEAESHAADFVAAMYVKKIWFETYKPNYEEES